MGSLSVWVAVSLFALQLDTRAIRCVMRWTIRRFGAALFALRGAALKLAPISL